METVHATNPVTTELYDELAPHLRLIVAHNITAPVELIDDACQLAWSRLLADPRAVRSDSYLGWLAVTASRALLHTLRVRDREVSYEQLAESEAGAEELLDPRSGDEMIEVRDRLLELACLPDRERRLLLLRGFGYGYEEISAQTGDSVRTVERLIRSGRRRASA